MLATGGIRSAALGLAVPSTIPTGATGSCAAWHDVGAMSLPASGITRDIAAGCDEDPYCSASPVTHWQVAVPIMTTPGPELSC